MMGTGASVEIVQQVRQVMAPELDAKVADALESVWAQGQQDVQQFLSDSRIRNEELINTMAEFRTRGRLGSRQCGLEAGPDNAIGATCAMGQWWSWCPLSHISHRHWTCSGRGQGTQKQQQIRRPTARWYEQHCLWQHWLCLWLSPPELRSLASAGLPTWWDACRASLGERRLKH